VLKLEQYQWLMLLCGPGKKNLHTISTACTACLYMAMLTCSGGFTTFCGGRWHLHKERHDR
jgi:hypothetical protein